MAPEITTHTLLGHGVPEGPANKLGLSAQPFLDSNDVIVHGQVCRPARGTTIHLSSAELHLQFSDESILSLPRVMGHHDIPTIELGQLTHLQRCSHRAYLVHLEQEAAIELLTDSLGTQSSLSWLL